MKDTVQVVENASSAVTATSVKARWYFLLGLGLVTTLLATVSGSLYALFPILFILGIEAGCNVLYRILARGRHRARDVVVLSVVVDFLAVTALLHYLGGARAAFAWLYLPPLVLCARERDLRGTLPLSMAATGLFTALLLLERFAPAPSFLTLFQTVGETPRDLSYILTLVAGFGILFHLAAVLQTRSGSGKSGEPGPLGHKVEGEPLTDMTPKGTKAQLARVERLSAIGELVSGVAHELNNPLSGILGYSQLLMEKDSITEIKNYMQKITLEAVRCQKIVQNLLAFARTQEPQKDKLNVNEVVERALELREYQLVVDDIKVVKNLGQSLPPITGDFYQMVQVFLNIINNAHKAMKSSDSSGTITIATESNGPVLSVKFTDTGPGISAELLSKIFDPFFTTRDPGEGVGLGLSLAYGIVKEHGGNITVSSEAGEGSTFTVELPAGGPAEVTSEASQEQKGRPVPVAKAILVVDDEPVIAELLDDVLADEGHFVEAATNGSEAISMIRDGKYDLVISDLKMPGVNGQQLYAEIRKMNPELASRMLFSTGDTMSPESRKFLHETGCDFLAKPFSIEDVRQKVTKALLQSDGEN